MNKIFIDCGFHHGEGLIDFFEKGLIDQKTKVFSFEANPECNLIERIIQLNQRFNIDITGIEKAIWINDGEVDFLQEDHIISNTGSPSDGYSNIDGWGSSVKEVNFVHKGYGPPIRIPCIDFSKFLIKLPKGKITCKMDIEGSEFVVLRHLIKENTVSIINELFIEFHERFIENESKETEQALIEQIKSHGVTVNIWW